MNEAMPFTRPGRDWLPYALLEVPSLAEMREKLEVWLTDALRPLALPVDLSEKILASAQDTAASISERDQHTRLIVFTPAPLPDSGQTWGFFRTVRNEEKAGSPTGRAYVIAFYLYVERAATME